MDTLLPDVAAAFPDLVKKYEIRLELISIRGMSMCWTLCGATEQCVAVLEKYRLCDPEIDYACNNLYSLMEQIQSDNAVHDIVQGFKDVKTSNDSERLEVYVSYALRVIKIWDDYLQQLQLWNRNIRYLERLYIPESEIIEHRIEHALSAGKYHSLERVVKFLTRQKDVLPGENWQGQWKSVRKSLYGALFVNGQKMILGSGTENYIHPVSLYNDHSMQLKRQLQEIKAYWSRETPSEMH